MTNPPCTDLSLEEERQIMKAFPAWLSDEEEALARRFFQPLVFFRTVEKGVRRCVCTSCMEGFFAHKEISPAFFKATHGKRCECPNCGQAATLAAMGKFKDFSKLTSHERAVQISVYGDWLLVQSGWLWRTFGHEDLGGDLTFEPYRRYAFAPGRRMMWQRNMAAVSFQSSRPEGPWERQKRVRQPFSRQPGEREAAYIPLGAENLSAGPLRYSGFAPWFGQEYGGDLNAPDFPEEPFRISYLVRYLAEYTQYPQLELLTKLGYHQVVSDLVIQNRPHRDILDWTASNPADFFRLSRHDFKLFKNGAGTFSLLKLFRRLRKAGLVGDLLDFDRRLRECGADFALLCRCCLLAGVSLERGNRYLQFITRRDGPAAGRFWLDYLEAAKTLKYDLRRDDVRMPRRLRERHDEAAAAASLALEKKARKNMNSRYAALMRQFAFSDGSLCICAPLSIQEIVDEGKALRHCVGGYAERHMRGAATILFLRKMKNPAAPYVTIEMSTENNCEKLCIRQIHGFKNDLSAKVPPEKRHAAFLAAWLDWVHAGSPRDAEGRPATAKHEPGAQASA